MKSDMYHRPQTRMPNVNIPCQNNPAYLRSTLILSSHISLDLTGSLLSAGYPNKTTHAFLFFLMRAT
jgi:hypothetical protein